MLCLVCSMMPLVFLQVLEPFCPLSEQEYSEPEELEVNQPPSSNTVFIISETELNSSPLPSDSSPPTHKDLSCTTSLTVSEAPSVPLTVVASPSHSASESPPPLSDCTPLSQPCMVSALRLSNGQSDPHPRALSVENDSCIPPQTQSGPPNSNICVDVIAVPLPEMISDESHCTQIENRDIAIQKSPDSLG